MVSFDRVATATWPLSIGERFSLEESRGWLSVAVGVDVLEKEPSDMREGE